MTNEDYKYLLADAPTIFKLIGLLLQDSSIKYIHQYDYALDNMGLTNETNGANYD